jgi:hypothetical protein
MLMGVKLHVRRTERGHSNPIEKKTQKRYNKTKGAVSDEENSLQSETKKDKNTFHNIHVKETQERMSMRRRKR